MKPKVRKNTKTITTPKHFTTVPPKSAVAIASAPASAKTALPAVSAVAVSAVAASPVAASTVTAPAVVASPASATAVTSPGAVDIKPLLLALRNLDADIAREAATSLGAAGDLAAVNPLIEVVKDSQHYFHSVVRSAAAVSLGQLKDLRAVNALLEAVNDPIVDPSIEAIRALVTLKDSRAINALTGVVRNANGFFTNSVRRAGVLGLINLGGESAIAELRRIAADAGEDAVIRSEAAAAVK